MIEFGEGDLLQAEVDALVNAVNTVGVMGKGIALQFKLAYPENYAAYRQACDSGAVHVGRVFVWDSLRDEPRRFVINFPTKEHWRFPSRLEYVDKGLRDLVYVITELDITSIAIPALGCGNGGLDWDDVLPLITRIMGPLPVRVVVYPPASAKRA